MSRPRSRPVRRRPVRSRAPLFAALGDETRLAIIARLGHGGALSITNLAADSNLTRQAVTKHLTVLSRAGLVRGARRGREQLFRLNRARVDDARRALDAIASQWDAALGRLAAFVEA